MPNLVGVFVGADGAAVPVIGTRTEPVMESRSRQVLVDREEITYASCDCSAYCAPPPGPCNCGPCECSWCTGPVTCRRSLTNVDRPCCQTPRREICAFLLCSASVALFWVAYADNPKYMQSVAASTLIVPTKVSLCLAPLVGAVALLCGCLSTGVRGMASFCSQGADSERTRLINS